MFLISFFSYKILKENLGTDSDVRFAADYSRLNVREEGADIIMFISTFHSLSWTLKFRQSYDYYVTPTPTQIFC